VKSEKKEGAEKGNCEHPEAWRSTIRRGLRGRIRKRQGERVRFLRKRSRGDFRHPSNWLMARELKIQSARRGAKDLRQVERRCAKGI